MKRFIFYISLIVSLMFCVPCFAAVGFYGATSLTGGGTGALDAIDGTNLTDGAAAYTVTATGFYVHHLNATSGAAESSPDVISPDANAGNKRWILVTQGDAALASIATLTETNGGMLYGTADNAYAWLAAGAEGTLLMGNGAGAPSWLSAGTAGYFLIGAGAADPVWTENPDIKAATGTSLDLSGNLDAGTATVGSGSITDSSGAISFGDENLVTTGTLGAGAATLGAITESGSAVPNATDGLDFFAATTSAELRGVLSDESGTGAAMFNTAPSIADGSYLKTDEIRAYDAAGLKLYEDGGAGIFVQDSTGNVGIGTIDPLTDFDLRGAMLLTRDGGNQFGLRTSTQRWDFDVSISAGDSLRFINMTSGTVPFRIEKSGPVVLDTAVNEDAIIQFSENGARKWNLLNDGDDSDKFQIRGDGGAADRFLTIDQSGNVGIGTAAPGNPLAVNRSGDGVIVDFESADTVEGNVSISGNTTSYNAFVGSHYTQLKDGQAEFPVGAVVVSTGEIIPCSVSKQKYTKVNPLTAVNIIDKADAVEIVDVEVEDKDNIISQESTYSFDPETGEEKETITYTYGTKTVQKKKLVDGAHFHRNTRQFYTIKPGYVSKKEDGKLTFYLEETVSKLKPNKEYFVYVDTTTTAADKRAYGVMLGKMSDDAKGMSFGKDIDPVYLIAQVGLFKIRVTDTNGNIENGDYLETSTRAMEAQKQASGSRLNSTIAKSMIDVDWATEAVDVVLGYKWKLIPCTF